MSLMAKAAIAPMRANMPRRLARAEVTGTPLESRGGHDSALKCREDSAAGHAHVARHRRALGAAVDDEVVALRLAQDRGVDRGVDEIVALGGAQRRAQVGGVFLPEAHIKRAGAGEPHAIA